MFGKRQKQLTIRSTQLSTLIAEGVEITGDIVFSDGMRIDGRVKGNVIGRSAEGASPALLVLSSKGHVEGSVQCGAAVINGAVTGDLEVEHLLELQSDARVSGTIRYRHLQMDVGAEVQGQLVKVETQSDTGNVVELGAEKSCAAGDRR